MVIGRSTLIVLSVAMAAALGALAFEMTPAAPAHAQTAKVKAKAAAGCPLRPKEKAAARVIGGEDASIANWPGFVALRINRPGSEIAAQYYCGGVLIHPNWVVTAGHCVSYPPGYDFRREGGRFVQRGLVLEGGTLEIVERATNTALPMTDRVLRAAAITLHPGWEAAHDVGLGDDIALIRLETPARGPIMKVSRSQQEETRLWVAGFGLTEPETYGVTTLRTDDTMVRSGAKFLQETFLDWYETEPCQRRISALGRTAESGIPQHARIGAGQICAGQRKAKDRPRDSCGGDSGGPLARTGTDGCPVLVGLVSYGVKNCGQADAPGVYTRISAYADWIARVAPGALRAGAASATRSLGSEDVVESLNALRFGDGISRDAISVSLDPAGDIPIGQQRRVVITSRTFEGYVIVIDIDANAAMAYLLPNEVHPDPVEIEPGQTIILPQPGARFQFTAGKPVGPSRVVVIASPDKALSERLRLAPRIEEAVATRGLNVEMVQGNQTGSDLYTIASSVLDGAREAASPNQWAVAEAAYRIVPSGSGD